MQSRQKYLILTQPAPVVYVELKRDETDEYLEAEITKEQFKQLNIQAGDFVYVQPKEVKVFIQRFCNLRVFTLNYKIYY